MGGPEVVTLAAAVAWGALITNLVVLPFFHKGEKLHQDYYATGEIDAALAAIESKKLVPTLARIFNRARDSQEDKRYRVNIENLLQSVDFLPDLDALQEALFEKNSLLVCFQRLNSIAGDLWRWGLCHVLLTLGIPAAWHWLPFADPWDIVFRALIVAAWIATLMWVLWRLFRFHWQMANFLMSLRSAKETGDG